MNVTQSSRPAAPASAVPGRTTMQAMVQRRYGTRPADVLRLERISAPAIAADEVLVRVRAAGVGVARSPWQSLWIGIMIGSAVTGAAAIAQGVRISTDANRQTGSPDTFVNASWIILEALAGAWVLLLVIYIVQLVVDHARDHRR